MSSSVGSNETVSIHWLKWIEITSVIVASVFSLLVAIDLVTSSASVNLGTGVNVFMPAASFGLIAASIAVVSLILGLKRPMFIAARWLVVISVIGVIAAPRLIAQELSVQSDSAMRWLLAVGLAVVAAILFTIENNGRVARPPLTAWSCLIGLTVPVAVLVENIFSQFSGESYGSLIAIPVVVALAFVGLLVTVLVHSASTRKAADKHLQHIHGLRTLFIVISLVAPVAIQLVRIFVAGASGSANSSADLFLTLFLMAAFTCAVWFGFKLFIKREVQIVETKSNLENSKARFSRALNNAGLGAWDRNIQTNELHWSDQIAPLFGYEPGELETTYENFLSAVHPDDRQSVVEAVNACMYEGAEYDIEHRVVWPDGTVRWMHERGDAQRDEDGTPLNMLGIIEDITESRNARLRLADSEEKHQTVVANVPGVVYSVDVIDGRPQFKYISPTFKDMFGVEVEDALKDFNAYSDTIHPEDKLDTRAAMTSSDRTGNVSWQGRIIVDGKVKWIESKSTRKLNSDGSIRVDGVAFDVTEKIETERLLSASEARFALVADNAPGMVYQVQHLIDGTVEIPYVSPGVEAIFGLTPADLMANPSLLDQHIYPEDLESNKQALRLALQTFEDFIWTGRIIRRDGEMRSIQASSRPVRLDNGTIHWDGLIIDITDEKRAEEELRKTRDRLADLLSSSPAVIYACEVSSPFALNFISENVFEHFGFRPADCLSDPGFLTSRTHPDDVKVTQDLLDEIEDAGHIIVEYRLRNSYGQYRWVRDEMRIVVRSDSREFVGTLIDITARKKAEEALRISDERFRAMSGASPLGIFMADENGAIIYVNSKMTDVLLVGQEKLYGDKWLELVHIEDRERVSSILKRSTSGETPFALECRLNRSDSNLIWCSIKAAPMFDHGSLIGFVGTVEDITDRHELEIESEQARIEAERANQAKSEFLSRMSHELRTPLNAILGYAQLLEMDSAKLDIEPLSQILKGGRHLLSLINEVLDIARIESGDLGIEFEPIKILNVIDEVVQLLQPIAHEKAVAIDVKIDRDDMTYVLADPQRLKQVVLNVLSNAIKYNKPEGIVTIMIEPRSDKAIALIIKDTGKGIAADKLYRLFTPFDRLGAEGSQVEGSGLGLALTNRLLSAMEGRIEIESEEGVGTKASIELQLSSNPELTLEPLRYLVGKEGDGKSKSARILLIEDNESNIRLMETIFSRRAHYQLDVAMTGSLGIDLAKKHRPDLILLDVNLPDSIGTNVIERLKSDPILKDTDVIVISADANKKQVERFRKAGAVAYLTKPVNVGELLRLVDGVLDPV